MTLGGAYQGVELPLRVLQTTPPYLAELELDCENSANNASAFPNAGMVEPFFLRRSLLQAVIVHMHLVGAPHFLQSVKAVPA